MAAKTATRAVLVDVLHVQVVHHALDALVHVIFHVHVVKVLVEILVAVPREVIKTYY